MVGTGRFELPTPRTPSDWFPFAYCLRRVLKLDLMCRIVNVYMRLRYMRIEMRFRRVLPCLVVSGHVFGQSSYSFPYNPLQSKHSIVEAMVCRWGERPLLE